MRIVIDARYLDGSFSGIATFSRCLVEHLALVDRTNHYFVIVREGFTGGLKLGPNFETLAYAPQPVSLASIFQLGNLINRLRPDVVHTTFPIAPLGVRAPQVVTVHDMQPFVDPQFSGARPGPVRWAYNKFYSVAYPASIRRAKWVLCDSQHTRAEVERFVPDVRAKLIVSPPGVPEEARALPEVETVVDAQRRARLDRPYAICYGSTRPNKNLAGMLRAWARVRALEPALAEYLFVLIVKRDRFFREAERVIAASKLGDSIRVLEQQPEADKHALLAGAKALFFATKYEGFGFPALEALALGVPVLAGRSGALPEIVGKLAVFADPFDPDAIADGMREVLLNPGHAERAAKEGPKHVGRFDWMEAATFIRDIYRLLI